MKMSNLLLQQIIQEELLKHLWALPMPFFLIFLTDSMSPSSRCPISYFSKSFKKSYSSIFGQHQCLSLGNTNLQNDSILPAHFVAGHISRNSSLFQNHWWEIKTSHKDSPSVPCISIPPSNHIKNSAQLNIMNFQNEYILPTKFVAGHITISKSLVGIKNIDETSHRDSPSVPCISIHSSKHSEWVIQ